MPHYPNINQKPSDDANGIATLKPCGLLSFQSHPSKGNMTSFSSLSFGEGLLSRKVAKWHKYSQNEIRTPAPSIKEILQIIPNQILQVREIPPRKSAFHTCVCYPCFNSKSDLTTPERVVANPERRGRVISCDFLLFTKPKRKKEGRLESNCHMDVRKHLTPILWYKFIKTTSDPWIHGTWCNYNFDSTQKMMKWGSHEWSEWTAAGTQRRWGRKMYKNGSWRDLPRKELISPTHFCKAPKSITASGISFRWSSLSLSTLQLLGWSGPEIIKEMFVLWGLIQLIFKWFAGCPTQVPESSREFYSSKRRGHLKNKDALTKIEKHLVFEYVAMAVDKYGFHSSLTALEMKLAQLSFWRPSCSWVHDYGMSIRVTQFKCWISVAGNESPKSARSSRNNGCYALLCAKKQVRSVKTRTWRRWFRSFQILSLSSRSWPRPASLPSSNVQSWN